MVGWGTAAALGGGGEGGRAEPRVPSFFVEPSKGSTPPAMGLRRAKPACARTRFCSV